MSDLFVARGDRLAARKVAGEMVILSADDSSLFVLNAVATAIWEAADGGTTLTAIVEGIVCPHYEIDLETAQRDALEFVSALEAHGLMRTSEAAVVAGSAAEYDAAVL